MGVKERLHQLVEELPESDLAEVERMLRGLSAPEERTEGLSPEERLARIRPLLRKHEAGTMTEEDRLELLRLGRGMSAHLPGSVDDFLREKHEDTQREETRLARRYQERAA